jgi:hypothetical protein
MALGIRLEAALERTNRVQRFEAGMAETPRPTKEIVESMPPSLYQYINGWKSESTRREQRAQAYRRHASGRGESWKDIMDDMMAPDVPHDTGLEPEESQHDE